MRIDVTLPAGNSIGLQVAPGYTVATTKAVIRERSGIPVGAQRLLFRGKQLEDPESLSESGVCNGARLELALRSKHGPAR